MSAKPKVVVVVGPTASGKSDLAVLLGKRFGGEVVSADSRQIYRGLDIGTGKISRKEMRGVPHHLLSVASPRMQFDAATYGQRAARAIGDILRRGKLPIVCGGTGFYIEAAIGEKIFPDVPPNPLLRKKLEQCTAQKLFAVLRRLDPERAAAIDPKNPRRLIRAIEIAHAIGKVPAAKREKRYETLVIGISIPREELRLRIRERLFRRMKTGMIVEVRRLHKRGLSWRRMEELGLEYRYVSRYLRGHISKQEMLVTLEREINRYAKRQMTWWKRDKNIIWISRDELKAVETLVAHFLANKNKRKRAA